MFTLPSYAKPYHNCFVLTVTPETAQQWLKNNDFNRPLKPRVVDKYVRQIKLGNWHRTHQGIAFDSEGTLLDGQHRLWAVVQSGQSVPMLVFLNESASVHENIDGGKPRSLLDVIRLELRDDTYKNKHILTVKSMYAGKCQVNQDYLTAHEVGCLLMRFEAAVRFAVDMLDGTGFGNTTVIGVIARAYQSVDKTELYAFCNALLTGQGTHPGMEYIRSFRHWLLGLRDRQEATRRDIYKRTEAVLNAFLNYAETCDMFAEHGEYYPLYCSK